MNLDIRTSVSASRRRLFAGAIALASAALLGGCIEAALIGGAATGASLANDRRPSEVVLGDERVEITAANRISQRLGDKVRVNVTSFNYTVLLTGDAPDAASRAEVERVATEVERVKAVVNEIRIGERLSLGARGNDTYLTGRVKAAMVAANKFNANHVKVVTEAGVVHLMGLVSRREADDATEIARGISGVQKVVRVFEYVVVPEPAKPAATDAKK